eukprot:5248034-Amphidinium_carterae.1
MFTIPPFSIAGRSQFLPVLGVWGIDLVMNRRGTVCFKNLWDCCANGSRRLEPIWALVRNVNCCGG